MSEVKFTKWQWSAHDKRPQCNGFSIFAENQYVAFVGDSDDNTDCKANAHLIAAAPEMYEMLEQLSSELRHAIGEVNDMRKAKICGSDLTPPDLWDAESCYLADKLLAKARGEQDA